MKMLSGARDGLKTAVMDFFEDDALTMGAALAFYTALSLAPMVILLLAAAGFLSDDVRTQFVQQIRTLAGEPAQDALQPVVRAAAQESWALTIASLLGLATLLLAATGVFAQLQYSLNRIWDIQAKPRSAVKAWLRKRSLSLGMILAIGFLLLVSLAVSAGLQATFASKETAWRTVDFLVPLLVYTGLFALMFKILPDAVIEWRDVWAGAAMTALLFGIGEWAMGKYLGFVTLGSAYGAAGSLVVMLVWVYYAALIVFFGAELTQVWARRHGRRIRPSEHAQWSAKAKARGPARECAEQDEEPSEDETTKDH